jgi:hypothetical protein
MRVDVSVFEVDARSEENDSRIDHALVDSGGIFKHITGKLN